MFGDPIINPLNWPTNEMSKAAPTTQGNVEVEKDRNWLLNLDAIEADTGIVLHKNYVSSEELNGSIISFSPEHILYSKLRPYLNKVVVPDESGFGTSELLPLLPDSRILNRIYFANVLRSDSFVHMFSAAVAGTKMPRVSMDTFRKFQLPLPSIDLQNQFADFVKQVDKSKLIAEQCAEKYDMLVKSRFIEMFGSRDTYSVKWQTCAFTDCCNVLYGFPFNSKLFNENGEGMPLIRIRDINSGLSGTYTTEKVSTEYEMKNGDLLVSMDGDFCAKIWNSGTALLNQRTCKMKGNKNIIDNIFLLNYLIPELEHIQGRTSATTVKHLSAKEINKMKIPIPSIELQNKFAEFVKQVDKSKYITNRD
jgi:type I restriction enzyme S subunit